MLFYKCCFKLMTYSIEQIRIVNSLKFATLGKMIIERYLTFEPMPRRDRLNLKKYDFCLIQSFNSKSLH